jgi:hypothetical protein
MYHSVVVTVSDMAAARRFCETVQVRVVKAYGPLAPRVLNRRMQEADAGKACGPLSGAFSTPALRRRKRHRAPGTRWNS